MKPVRLSVCIPTYNFGAFIGATLDSVCSQAGDDVEVVVVDGASVDDTESIVTRCAERFPAIWYHRRERNGGVDADLAFAVAQARGEHCWLLSSDDLVVPGGVGRMLAATTDADIVLCNRILCDFQMRPLHVQRWLSPSTPTHTFHLAKHSEALDYFSRSRSIGAVFSYISCIAFRRGLWPVNAQSSAANGTNFAHAHHLLAAALAGAHLRYLDEALILCRGDNDSFAAGGGMRRFRIDVDGYDQLARALFADEELRASFRAVLRHEHPWYRLAGPMSRATSKQERRDLRRRLSAFGYPAAALLLAETLGASPRLVGGLRRLRAALRGSTTNQSPAKDP